MKNNPQINTPPPEVLRKSQGPPQNPPPGQQIEINEVFALVGRQTVELNVCFGRIRQLEEEIKRLNEQLVSSVSTPTN